MSEDVSSQTNPDDVEALTSLATDDAGDAVDLLELGAHLGLNRLVAP